MPRAAFNHRDLNVPDLSAALPNGAATTYSAGIAVGVAGYPVVDAFELNISLPVLTTGEQPDAKTVIYSLQHDDDAAFGSPVTIPGYEQIGIQTGAGGAGAAAQPNIRVRLPTNCKANVRLKMVGSATGNSSTKSATIGRRW
jgi:hypothetical protein